MQAAIQQALRDGIFTSPIERLQKRKTPIHGDRTNNKRRSKRARLTRENLAHFDSLAELRSNTPTNNSDTMKAISTVSPDLSVRTVNNSIPPNSPKRPTRLSPTWYRHPQTQGSASPTKLKVKRHSRTMKGNIKQATIFPQAEGRPLEEHRNTIYYPDSPNRQFTGHLKDTRFNNHLSAPHRGLIKRPWRSEFHPSPIARIKSTDIYKTGSFAAILPEVANNWRENGAMMRNPIL